MPGPTTREASKPLTLLNNAACGDGVDPDPVQRLDFLNVSVSQGMLELCVAEQADNVFSTVCLNSQLQTGLGIFPTAYGYKYFHFLAFLVLLEH
jgi:hypothetical protein